LAIPFGQVLPKLLFQRLARYPAEDIETGASEEPC
jgi:hypothetical protein